MLARIVDLRDQLRRCYSVRMCDFFQAIPEFIFEADARLVSVKDDRVSDHRGFHDRPPKNVRRYHLVILCGEVVMQLPSQKNSPPLR